MLPAGSWRSRLTRAGAALVVAFTLVAPLGGQAGASGVPEPSWRATWSTSLQNAYPNGIPLDPNQSQTGGTVSPFEAGSAIGRTLSYPLVNVFPGDRAQDQTLRQMVRTTIGGDIARLALSNHFSNQPVTFSDVRIALRASGPSAVRGPVLPHGDTGASIVAASDRQLRFAGSMTLTLPPGAEAWSDRVSLPVCADCDVAISVYVAGASGPMTFHAASATTSYASDPGTADQAADVQGSQLTHPMASWFFIKELDVAPAEPPASASCGAVVALGDSITDAFYSTFDGHDRWTDVLARRLATLGPTAPSLVNAGIGANSVVADSSTGGESAPHRLARDVLEQSGVSQLIVYDGINDISRPPADIIAGLQQIVSAGRAAGLRVIGATLTPSPVGMQTTTRQAVNTWIRTGGAFDGVIDFAATVESPGDPNLWNPLYNSGDNLHPNATGLRAMGNTANLALFACQTPGAAIPEAPNAVLLPIAALLTLAGIASLRRTRSRRPRL